MPSPLQLLQRIILRGEEEAPRLLELLQHVRSRKPAIQDTNAWNRVTIPDEMASNLRNSDVRTHLFVNPKTQRAVGAYQLDSKGSIPYLLSDQPGLGSHLLEDAYFVAPQKPLSLHAIPGSEGFYRKQPGWVESQEEGISKFTRKAKGGLVQMKECGCGKAR